MTELPKYQEQFERVKRFYKRFDKIDKGRIRDMPSLNYEDEVYAFFIFCYHLKNWIINDETIRVHPDRVEEFINDNECLSLCTDICNGIKHLALSKERTELQPEFKNKSISLELTEGVSAIIGIKFNISTKTKTIDAFKLATECLQKWEEFIKENIGKNN